MTMAVRPGVDQKTTPLERRKKNNTTTLTGAYSTRENKMKYKHAQ